MTGPARLIEGTLYVVAVNADGTEYEDGAEPIAWLDEADL